MKQKHNFVVTQFQRLEWSVNRKINTCFSLLVVLIIVSSGLVFFSIVKLEDSTELERQKSLALVEARTFKEHVQNQLNAYSDAIFLTQQKAVNSAYSLQARDSMTRLKLADPDSLQNPASWLVKLDNSYEQLNKIFMELNKLLLDQNLTKASEIWSNNLSLRNFTITAGDEYLKQLEQETAQLVDTSQFTSAFTKITAIAAGVLGVIFAFFMGWLVSTGIGKPLAIAGKYLERVSRGDLSGSLELDNRDELGNLARALNLSVKTFRGLFESFNIGSHIEEAVLNLTTISSQQASYAREQASAVSQVSSSMRQLSVTAEAINDSANTVVEAAQTTLNEAQSVTSLSDQVGEAVKDLNQAVNEAGQTIEKANLDFISLIQQLNELDKQSASTEKITGLITEIAYQTHLLAINASIEAVGAGQYGERFMIIAQEVKDLAARCSKAAEEIRGILAHTRQYISTTRDQAEESQTTISAVVDFGSRVEQLVETVLNQVGSNQRAVLSILEAAEKSTYQANQIKTAAYEQQVASQQILSTVFGINEAVRAGAQGSDEVASTSAQLTTISRRLTNQLAELKMPLTQSV